MCSVVYLVLASVSYEGVRAEAGQTQILDG